MTRATLKDGRDGRMSRRAWRLQCHQICESPKYHFEFVTGEEVQIKAGGKNLLASCGLMVVNFTPKRYIKVSEVLYNLCCFPSSFLPKDQRTPLLEAVKKLTEVSESGISCRISPASSHQAGCCTAFSLMLSAMMWEP